LLEPEHAELPSIPGLLVAPEGQAPVEWRTVEIDPPCPDAVRYSAGTLRIAGLNETSQAERRNVCNRDRLVLGLIAHDRQHGSEYLLARNRHFRLDVSKHRRADVIASVELCRAA